MSGDDKSDPALTMALLTGSTIVAFLTHEVATSAGNRDVNARGHRDPTASGDRRGGVLGLAVAFRLQQRHPSIRVEVIEKERAVAMRQTGRNSGVVYAGIYYTPGSQKARLCAGGGRQLREYCASRGLGYDECGKLIVARGPDGVPRLRNLLDRGRANGVRDLRWLDSDALVEVEPHARGVAAVHSPHTAIVDFNAVSNQLARDVNEAGGAVLLDEEVHAIVQSSRSITLDTSRESRTYDLVIACAGLQSDRVAKLVGDAADPAIVPFRGEYLALRPERTHLVRGLIYPVPDPRCPFLGVHLTRRVDGGVTIGPNAVLALSRQGYRRRDVSWRDLTETLRWPRFAPLGPPALAHRGRRAGVLAQPQTVRCPSPTLRARARTGRRRPGAGGSSSAGRGCPWPAGR
jgi:L-2-hydroxyglutarate oxidase LhgO